MFYQPGTTDHGLPHDPFKVWPPTPSLPSVYNPTCTEATFKIQACVVPRPIGWISTKSPNGISNLAPYSQFTNLTFDPPYVVFSANQTVDGTRKDTVKNIEATGHFVWNLATYPLREAVNITAEQVPYGVDEFERAKLTKESATLIDVDMVKESPVKFECVYHSTMRLPGNPPMGTVDVVVGRVIGVHVDEGVIDERGRINVAKTQPIARLGYYEYAVVKETFEMVIPGANSKAVLYGLEGSAKSNRERFESGMGEKSERNISSL
ncbi:hypothetical protein BJX63DRAFT_429185 [Aspergillus granulosus]|uniref:Flavin reductase like domain-containing protein n=1 Tax=Aspergillus granulosus TaxID=176169 RepID=A0ABR4HTG7_9EURO